MLTSRPLCEDPVYGSQPRTDHEAQGEHGSTHFLEHMVYQGTTSVGTKDFEAEKPILHEIYETEQEPKPKFLTKLLPKDAGTPKDKSKPRNPFDMD